MKNTKNQKLNMSGVTSKKIAEFYDKKDKADFKEMITQYFEIDINNCIMTNKNWIDLIAELCYNKNGLNDFKKECFDYLKDRQ